MRFGPLPLDQAEGAILAHSELLPEGRLRKGQVLGQRELAALAAAGRSSVVAARLEPGDVTEDLAAARLAGALVPDPAGQGLVASVAFTGRVNLNATGPGVVELDVAAIHALNLIHPAITLATLPPLHRVQAGMLVGTVKIITYAVPDAALKAACAAARDAIGIRPVALGTAGLLLTEVPGMDDKLIRKGRRAIEARLKVLGVTLADCRSVAHDTAAIASALQEMPGEMLLILTGSATSDAHDTAPEGLRAAGGVVERFGMPVDPGNLLFLGHLDDRPVIGLPGCARSPALNGADWVLERIACGLRLDGDAISAMGVGGLLKESPVRPQPREPADG